MAVISFWQTCLDSKIKIDQSLRRNYLQI